MPDSEWRRFGLSESEAGALLQQADEIANGITFDPDVRDDLKQEALAKALEILADPPDDYPTEGLALLRKLRTPMWQAASKFCSRKAFDTPLDHSGRPHSEIQLVVFHD